jgi:eukaryotic-like serine/threonine-protein kinase
MPPMIAIDDWLEALEADESGRQPAASAELALEPGAVVGGTYRIVRPLGSGSMGVVFIAHDETLDRRVAIKFPHPSLLGPRFRERFLAEARSMARVSHPAVLPVYAFGEHGDTPYFVMEFVSGQSLAEWLLIHRSPPDLERGLRILDDVCRGVAAIHAANTVHHDIKPSNILLDDTLRPRVADLGLAVFYREDEAARHELIGTPAYMAPEIAFSKGSDPMLRSRADVYSIACVAYEILTGATPFDGAGNLGMLLQHATKVVAPPSSIRPSLPRGFDDVMLRALAKDPVHRTPTVEAFRRDLIEARERLFEMGLVGV